MADHLDPGGAPVLATAVEQSEDLRQRRNGDDFLFHPRFVEFMNLMAARSNFATFKLPDTVVRMQLVQFVAQRA